MVYKAFFTFLTIMVKKSNKYEVIGQDALQKELLDDKVVSKRLFHDRTIIQESLDYPRRRFRFTTSFV